MSQSRRVAVCSALSALSLLGAAFLYAGPLNPPAGPVTSTYKTLTEVEPRTAINSTNTPGDADSNFRISASGSYYLTDSLVAGIGKSAIEIAASNVTIDLNGFTITSLSTLPSIRVTVSGRSNISVRNGNIGPGGGGGIDLTPSTLGTQTVGGSVERVHVAGTLGIGIRVGNGVVVRNGSVSNNTLDGINAGIGCTVADCVATDNGRFGIDAGERSMVQGCAARGNAMSGIRADYGATIIGCVSNDNTNSGIFVAIGCTISQCTAAFNGTNGIATGSDCNVFQCMSHNNRANGIIVSARCTISDCNVNLNDLDGINVADKCFVVRNNAADNGASGAGAGIHATDVDNRIEGNTCTSGDVGIDVDRPGNIIIKNTCSGNVTNWSVAAGNALAPIVSASLNISAVNGNTYGGSLGSTDPNANFTY